jgi:hypothetical protein
MANMSITDINDGTVYEIVKGNVVNIYNLDEFRIVIMNDGKRYEVSETFVSLVSDVGPPI